MDNKYRKIYNKALDFHEKGEIDKALDLCETILAENLGESEILNFKGLILYEKGMLKDAITVWKINIDLNNDSMAKSYIKDAEHDEERVNLYKDAEQALRKLDINTALSLFFECSKSDFNCIKVNTGIAMCYQKKGDYYRAREYVDKALKIDKNAVTANEIKKQLDDSGFYYGQSKSKRGAISASIVAITIAILSIGGYLFWNNYSKNNNDTTTTNSEIVYEQIDKDEVKEDEINNENKDIEKNNLDKFDVESLEQDIKNSDYNSIYEKVHNTQVDKLNSDEKKLYDKAVSILKKDGVANFYEQGLLYFNQKDFDNAKDQLIKAYEYSEGNDLNQHIIFYRGSTASEQGDKNLTLEMYEKYNELYPNGPYIEGVLYELALLNSDSNKEEANLYAQKLINNYPESIYINDRIMNIVNMAN